MTRELPSIDRETFERRLRSAADALASDASDRETIERALSPRAIDALFAHYEELRRWNRRVSLIGPGTVDELVARHYGESLAALPLIASWLAARTTPENEPGARRGPALIDVGSGAGFPGFVIAAVLPELEVTLIEARERKWAFLAQAARRAGLDCRCLHLHLDLPLADELPERIDALSVRALKLPRELLDALRRRMPADGRLLSWQAAPVEPPPGFAAGRVVRLAGSDRRVVAELPIGVESPLA